MQQTLGLKVLGYSALPVIPHLFKVLCYPFLPASPLSPLSAFTIAETDRHAVGHQAGTNENVIQNARAIGPLSHEAETQLINCLPAPAGTCEMFDSPGDGSAV
jgi:hypothetical protein